MDEAQTYSHSFCLFFENMNIQWKYMFYSNDFSPFKDGTFNTWMLEESDLIQGAARAYGDNLILTRWGFGFFSNECCL